MRVNRKHVLDLDDFSVDELEETLETAEAMREILSRPIKKAPALRGKTVANLFYEPSTRTRVSFEIAAKALSADVVNMAASGSSVEKGESLVDTIRTLQALGADVVVIRHSKSGAPYLVAEHLDGSVINAGDGWHAHPTQALLDAFTIRRRLGRVAGLKVVILGDVWHSRVARSNLWSLTKLGADVTLCGPPTLLPAESVMGVPGGLPAARLETSLERALADADVVMALRLQRERMQAGLLPSIREYCHLYQLDAKRLALAKPEALVMHPGPMNEGIEIAPDVAHGAQSVIEEQVTNGVAIRMALLYLLAEGRAEDLPDEPRRASAAKAPETVGVANGNGAGAAHRWEGVLS
ncbi:MAG: aspartate carbamoyltransferase catalytic subunit [Chloroflexi bacterium]|nr:aspartate carbamoyltransferase catalytic subunit [Chloroflexota bacterium]